MSELTAAAVRSLRQAKPALDPWAAPATHLEEERLPDGRRERCLTVFLIGAECPFTCVFCDLWRNTLDAPTPSGSLPAQLRSALSDLPAGLLETTAVKLYNASNFFDPRAVPREDLEALAGLLALSPRVVVECHPRFVTERCQRFAQRLGGKLEVAMGLETVHPDALPRLGKGMTLEDFDRAARFLVEQGIGVRAFVLVGAPFVPAEEAAEWAVRSARHAYEVGATTVSLIPVRGGNGAMEELARRGEWSAPTLGTVEDALDGALEVATRQAGEVTVQADTWDLDRLSGGEENVDARIERIRRINLTGRTEPRPEVPA